MQYFEGRCCSDPALDYHWCNLGHAISVDDVGCGAAAAGRVPAGLPAAAAGDGLAAAAALLGLQESALLLLLLLLAVEGAEILKRGDRFCDGILRMTMRSVDPERKEVEVRSLRCIGSRKKSERERGVGSFCSVRMTGFRV